MGEDWCQGQARSTRSALVPSLTQPMCCATKFGGALHDHRLCKPPKNLVPCLG